jgi:hypothetical protein
MNLGEGVDHKPHLRLIPLSAVILYRLYQAHLEDDTKDEYGFDDIQKMLNGQASRKIILSAIKYLMSEGRAGSSSIRRSGKSGEYFYAISLDGIFRIEKELNRRNSVAYYLRQNPDADLEDIAGFEGLFLTADDRFDTENWMPLPIDRQSNEYKNAIEKLEEALEVIRGDNGFAQEYPGTRDGIVETITEGYQELKSGSPTLQRVKSSILSPLRWVFSNFANTVMGVAAKNAADALWQFIMNALSR